MAEQFDIPVVLYIFHRLDTVKLILEVLKEVKPNKLYVFADGPRVGKNEEELCQQVRDFVDSAVDWECDFRREYSDINLSCSPNIVRGFNQVLKENPYGIFLEDDAVPLKEFFYYCQFLLKEYEDNKKINFIAGFNAIGDRDVIKESYTFAKYAPMSGAIAIWSDRWFDQDVALSSWSDKKNKKKVREATLYGEFRRRVIKEYNEVYKRGRGEWDVVLNYNLVVNDQLAIAPKHNLVKSFGYADGAFHVQEKDVAKRLAKLMDCIAIHNVCLFEQIEKLEIVEWNKEYEIIRQKLFLAVHGNWLVRRIKDVYMIIKNIIYGLLPKKLWKILVGMIKR